MTAISIDPVERTVDDEMWIREYTDVVFEFELSEQDIDFDLDNLPPPPAPKKSQEEINVDAYNRAMGILK